MSVSACLISFNEIDSIRYCLNWLDSLSNLNEICVLDSFSTDGTWQEIYTFKSNKNIIKKQQKFESFGKQKNDCIEMATSDWILLIDCDESYSFNMDKLVGDINQKKLEKYNAVRIMTFITYPDRNHFIHQNFTPFGLDPHVRMWKKDHCKYIGECHEELHSHGGRNLHYSNDNDILNINFTVKEYPVVMLHHQLLKTDKSLKEKGERWAELDMLKKSADRGIEADKETWVRFQKSLKRNYKMVTLPIPLEYRDSK